MKIRMLIPFLFVAVFVFAGCEGAKYPLSDPGNSSIDERLTGSWKIEDPEGNEQLFLNIFAFNDHEYYVESWESGNADEMVRLNVFSTEIDDVLFASMRCINCDEDDSLYRFLKYEISDDDELVVRLVDDGEYDEMEDFKSMDAVHYYVRTAMKEESFFDDEVARYRRLEKEPARQY